ncbi:MAG: endonuclease V [Thermoplasmatales archaeon]|nr:MAG: endonuclease V [Thermoplasmatales archaeon]
MNLFDYTYNLVRQIPEGKISSYGEVAKALGDIIASRAVGRMMNQNPNADDMPCFKIVHSDGRIGGFGLGIDDKIRRLEDDSVFVNENKIVNFENVLFKDFKTQYPLKKLRKEQIELSKKVILKDDFPKLETVAGIDVSYPKSEFENATGACVVMDYKTKDVIDQITINVKTEFPYISTYLAYRELPVISQIFKNLKTKPSIFMFDGNGILHPYAFGLASHAGVFFDVPSIGVAKRLLYGDVIDNDVLINGKKRGFIYYSSDRVKNPIYVSPGHRISFKTSLEIVKHLSFYKIPEPLRKAHILASKKD